MVPGTWEGAMPTVSAVSRCHRSLHMLCVLGFRSCCALPLGGRGQSVHGLSVMLGHLGSDPSSATHQLRAFLLSEPHFEVVVRLQPDEGRRPPVSVLGVANADYSDKDQLST